MSTLSRMGFSASLFLSSAFVGTWWLYFMPNVDALVQQYAGPFIGSWGLIKWAIPTTCGLLMLLAAGYLVFGGVQEERATQTTRGPRR